MIGSLAHSSLLIWFVGLIWTSAMPASGQEYGTWRHFNSNSGLPQNSVVDMELDTAGYVWIATEGGLVRYDGGGLRTFELKGRGALTAKRIRRIIPTKLGEIIVEDANGNGYDIHGHIAPLMIHSGRQIFQNVGGVPSVEVYSNLSRPRQPYTADPHRRWVCHPTSTEDMVVLSPDSIWFWHDTSIVRRKALPYWMDRIFVVDGTIFGATAFGELHSVDAATGETASIRVNGNPNKNGEPWPQVFWHQGHPSAFMVVGDHIVKLRKDASSSGLIAETLSMSIPPGHTITDILDIPGTRTILVGTSTTGLHVFRAEMLHAVPCEGHVITRTSVFGQAPAPGDGVLFTAGRQVYNTSSSGCYPVRPVQR